MRGVLKANSQTEHEIEVGLNKSLSSQKVSPGFASNFIMTARTLCTFTTHSSRIGL